MATNTMTLLNTVTVGAGGAASVTFSNIPQNYTDLVVMQSSRATSGGLNLFIRFNGDNGNTYSWKQLYGNGSAAASDSGAIDGAIRAGFINPSTYTANTFTNSSIYIPNYVSNNYKSSSVDGVMENNATTSYADFVAGVWNNTSAITSITIFADATIAQYSEFTLYGVWNASDVTAPGTPLISGVADGGGGSALVTVSPSGSAAASYTVTSSPGGFTATSASNPVQVYGLSPATAYTFTAVGNNPLGSSTASASSASLTPYKGYVALATVTVGAGGAASISFSSIDQNYSHLQLRGTGRSTRAAANDEIILRYNSDTGANYVTHRLYGDGASVGSQAFTAQTYALIGDAPAATASLSSTFNGTVVDILEYTNTNKYKTTRTLAGRDENGVGYVWFNSNLWQNTAAINTVTIKPLNGTAFAQYSTFTLYGVK